MTVKNETLSGLLSPCAVQAQADIELWLADAAAPAPLRQAMAYCVLGGGKRLRPAIVYLAAEAAGNAAGSELTRRAAVAVELVHCYSLVHDDLPAMDNDTLRRGQPTAHVKFGQAMAILAGDALLTRAFAVLAGSGNAASARLVAELAAGAGETGMIAGQVADMGLCALPGGLDGMRYIHERKTAALIRAAARMGGICAGADEQTLCALSDFGRHIGLAFQLVDDLLDVTGEAATLGKTPGKDATSGKVTVLTQLGQEASRKLADELTDQAISSVAVLGPRADKLVHLARLLGRRRH